MVVYQRVNGIWQFTHALIASKEHAVGFERPNRCGPETDRFGADNAFIFERDDDGVWQEVALLSNPDCGWFFGGSTATDGKRILSSAQYIGE